MAPETADDNVSFSGASPATARRTLRSDELRAALATSCDWLERHAEALNALNVFPVPDGDTGLNMSLTLRAAVDEMARAPGAALGDVAAALARGALMGARGNSGVILAQYLRGLARALEGHEVVDANLAARALTAGADAAYAAVARPVEGTILTVASAAARAATAAAGENADLVATMEGAHRAAQTAVARTPEQLPVLKQAGVVDSGGEGFRVILEGLLVYARGERLSDAPVRVDLRADLSALHQDTDDFFGYCTEVLFRGEGIDVDQVRDRLAALGSCVLVIGDPALLKVHVHTEQPGAVLNLATELGEIVKVKVDNMQLQHEEFARGQGLTAAPAADLQPGTNLVAVAIGTGFVEVFESLGAVVVTGVQTFNPSVEQIVAAINQSPRADVIIAANDRNVVLAARQAAGLVPDRKVEVLATVNMSQGLAAALALNPDADARTNLTALDEAIGRCHAVEMTTAVRDAQLGDLQVKHGARFAILDGDPVATAETYRELLTAALERLPAGPHDIVTVYWGGDGTPDEAEALATAAAAQVGTLEAEVKHGGQPQFAYVVSVE